MGSVKAPKPTAAEEALRVAQKESIDLQNQIIRSQIAQNKILLPFLAEQEGFNIQLDNDGNITAISKRADPDEELQKEIQRELNQRSLKALKGELPVDPGLERDITSQREALQNKLAKQYGAGYSTASPAIEALQRFDESSNILREGARTGQLTLAEQLGMSREQQNQFTQQSQQDVLRQSAIGDPLTFAGAQGQVANNYLRAQQPYIADRQMQLQARIATQQNRMSLFGAGIGAVGALFSDADLKKDLERIGTHPSGVPIYIFTRRDTGEKMMGVLAQDVAKVKPWLVSERDGYLMVNYSEL
jgi:hypothetical protein